MRAGACAGETLTISGLCCKDPALPSRRGCPRRLLIFIRFMRCKRHRNERRSSADARVHSPGMCVCVCVCAENYDVPINLNTRPWWRRFLDEDAPSCATPHALVAAATQPPHSTKSEIVTTHSGDVRAFGVSLGCDGGWAPQFYARALVPPTSGLLFGSTRVLHTGGGHTSGR